MTALLEQVAAAVEELFDGVAVRWPDAPDLRAELQAVWDEHPPLVRSAVMLTMLRLASQAETLSEFVDGIDAKAICRFGQQGDGEVCKALLDLGDRLREWRDEDG
jgi:hypothetical protein